MTIYGQFQEIDLTPFEADDEAAPARYGLPQKVEFCRSCRISNQRPNSTENEYSLTTETPKVAIHFEDGVCDACRAWKKKHHTIDYDERWRMLEDICDRHRRTDGRYDCLVPGSGGKDSIYAAHVLKYKLGMHPLTITWAPHLYTPWGWDNLQAWIHSGFDNVLVTPNGKVHRLLSRLALENMFHPFQPFVLGQKTLAARLAVQYDIPLIFFGDHATDWGVPLGESDDSAVNFKFATGQPGANVFVAGVSLDELRGNFGLNDNDLHHYMPVDPAELRRVKAESHYLGFFMKWHPQANYYFSMENTEFRPSPERNPGTYSKYNSLDDQMDDFNWWCYYIKFGIGRATYDASQEVRAGDIELSEAISLIQRYDGEYPERFEKGILKYLSVPEGDFPGLSQYFAQPVIDRDYMYRLADQFRSPHVWKYENGAWSLRATAWEERWGKPDAP